MTPFLLRYRRIGAGVLAQPLLLGYRRWASPSIHRLSMAGAMKLADRSLAYSINRTARELLYTWVDAATIYRAKAWIDMVGYRGFKIAGSLSILLLTQWLPWKVSDAGLSWAVVAMCAGWIAAGLYLVRRLLPEMIVRTQRAAAPEPTPKQPRERPTVLVAEDHEQVALLLKIVLERWGFKVIAAADGRTVLQYVESQAPPDLAVLDINLPHVDGFALVNQIRVKQEWRDVPILMLTGQTGEREINRALASGANDYMIKPFNLEELKARIARLLPMSAPPETARLASNPL